MNFQSMRSRKMDKSINELLEENLRIIKELEELIDKLEKQIKEV